MSKALQDQTTKLQLNWCRMWDQGIKWLTMQMMNPVNWQHDPCKLSWSCTVFPCKNYNSDGRTLYELRSSHGVSHPHSSQFKHAHVMTVAPFKHFNVQFICSFFILDLEWLIRLVKRCELVYWCILVAPWLLVEMFERAIFSWWCMMLGSLE